MGFGQITKQLAKEVVGNQMKDVIDSLRPADAAARAEALASAVPPGPAGPADNISAVIIAQIQAMQNSLKEEQELVVLCTIGLEMMRVLEVYAPSPRLLVLTGLDTERGITRVIAPVESLQLVCKPMPLLAGAKAATIRIINARPKTP
jgi:hypothetical protein